jgi:hypothetical protein
MVNLLFGASGLGAGNNSQSPIVNRQGGAGQGAHFWVSSLAYRLLSIGIGDSLSHPALLSAIRVSVSAW